MKPTSFALACLVAFASPPSGQEKPKDPVPAAQDATLSAERREFAEIQLLLGAERDYAQAKERLRKLVESLSGRAGKEAKTLLGEVELLERKVRRALGEPIPSDLSLLVDVVKSEFGDTVDEAVLAALNRKDFTFLSELGVRAGPGLAQAVRAEPDVLPGEVAQDPMFLLLRRDPRRGDELLGELLEHDSFFWKKRVVRALGEAQPWNGKALFSTESPRRWLGPGIQGTLEKYAADPDVGNTALASLGGLWSDGARSDAFQRLIAEALRSSDGLRRETAKGVVRNCGHELMRPILEAALEDGDGDLRRFASRMLCERPESRSLLAHADDPEVDVRKCVLRFLEKSDRKLWQNEEPAVLAKLLEDEDANVRESAWKVVRELPLEDRTTTLPAEQGFSGSPVEFTRKVFAAPLPDEAYRALLRRPEASERSRIPAIATRLAPPLCFELFTALAADSDAGVRAAAYSQLNDLPFWADPDATLRIIASLRDDPALPQNVGSGRDALRSLAKTRAGLTALVRWIIARNDVELWETVDPQSLAAIHPGLFADYMTWLFERDRLPWDSLDNWAGPALRALGEDRSRPIVLRVLALASDTEDERLGATVEEFFADPAWGAFDPEESSGLGEALHKLVSRLHGEARNRAITVILDNPAFPEWLSDHPLSACEYRAPGAAAIGKRVLARWFGQEDQSRSAVREAIEAMASLPELRDDRVLAAATRRNTYAHTAWETIAVLKDPAFLPVIRAALEESGERKAAEALFGYLSDDAAELLLVAAAKVQSTTLRDKCLAHLEKIREYQDSRERWATRKVKTETREQVIAKLLEQLSAKSDDVKVQAIRALATWEAVEVMPRLIELTTSGSKPVAAAAREALERLNAPKKD